VRVAASILSNASYWPRTASVESIALFHIQSAELGTKSKKQIKVKGLIIIPKTPLNHPRMSSLRVTESRMLLIRSRVFDTPSSLLARSRKPYAPPRARSVRGQGMWSAKTIRWLIR
jgi:hypothetical protein